jgi:predicted nucleic acid-binding protein
MMAEPVLVDTNVLVRFITGQPPALAMKARKLVEQANADEIVLVVAPLILAETVFTLESFYHLDRKEVAAKLRMLLKSRGFKVLDEVVTFDALDRHYQFNISIADTYLAALSVSLGHKVASFDKDFDKLTGVTRYSMTD